MSDDRYNMVALLVFWIGYLLRFGRVVKDKC